MYEQMPPPNHQSSYVYGQQIMPSEKADLLEKIKPDAIVEQMYYNLQGIYWENGKQVVQKDGRRISERGAWDMRTLMLSASSQNVALSKLKDEEIKKITLRTVRTALQMCLRNWKEYGIKGTDQLCYVLSIVHTNTLITLRQSENEGIRSLIKGTTTEVRNVNSEEKKPSILGRFIRS